MVETSDFASVFNQIYTNNFDNIDSAKIENFPDTFLIDHKSNVSNDIHMENNESSDQMDFTEATNPGTFTKQKQEYDLANKYYFLKFKNVNNGCFANSVIQSLLGLGNNFFKMIDILPLDFPVNDTVVKNNSIQFWTEIKMFINKTRLFSNEVICSMKFRKIIDLISMFKKPKQIY